MRRSGHKATVLYPYWYIGIFQWLPDTWYAVEVDMIPINNGTLWAEFERLLTLHISCMRLCYHCHKDIIPMATASCVCWRYYGQHWSH